MELGFAGLNAGIGKGSSKTGKGAGMAFCPWMADPTAEIGFKRAASVEERAVGSREAISICAEGTGTDVVERIDFKFVSEESGLGCFKESGEAASEFTPGSELISRIESTDRAAISALLE